MVEKKVVMIIAHRNFRDEELLDTKKVIEASGVKAIVASTELTTATGMFGAKAIPNIKVEDVKVEDYDGIIFVGGSGAETYFSNKKALEIAKKGYEKNKVVGAICIAPAILANAGILKAKKATVWNGKYKEILKKGGAIYTGEPVTTDGKIVTANGPESASSFGKKIVEVLGR